LQSIAGKRENNVAFALMLVGDRLLTLVQPTYPPHQLKISDLHLIVNFIGKQPGLTSSELWLPMCLPRLNETGFLYAYTSCLDIQSNLTLILISSHNTTEQFQILRSTSRKIRETLNVPPESHSILTIKNNETASSSSPTNAVSSDVIWERTSGSFDNSSTTDEGFVNISADMLRKDGAIKDDRDFLQEVRDSLQCSSINYICNRYLKDDDSISLLHFLFRLDVPVVNSIQRDRNRKQHPGYLPQCLSPSISPPLDSISFRKRLWSNYQKLSLRLRLGSATVESSIDAFDMIKNDSSIEESKTSERAFTGIGRHCPAIGLSESAPYNSDGLSYIIEGNEIFLAMNGKNFEL